MQAKLAAMIVPIVIAGFGAAWAQVPAPAPSATPSSAAPADRPPPLPPARGPSMAVALDLAHETVAVCTKAGFPVAVSVVDSTAQTKLDFVPDPVNGHSIVPASRKAMTAATFKMASGDVGERAKTDPAIAAQLAANPNFLTHLGGEPLMAGNDTIGGIAASGAPDAQDDACVKAAIAKFKSQIK